MFIQRHDRKKRSWLLFLVIAVVFLLATVFVFLNGDHDCIQDGCPVCQQIQACINALNGFSGFIFDFAAVGFVYASFCMAFSKPHLANRAGHTLIQLKVRLNN